MEPNIQISQHTTQTLLEEIQKRFYKKDPRFYQHRKDLIKGISWPAHWMQQKHLYCDDQKYQQLIQQKLREIKQHGNPEKWHPYFPSYLLKCLQDHFRRNHDQLYYELSHIRNILETIAIRQNTRTIPEEQFIEQIAQAHKILQCQKRRSRKTDPQQMTLF